MHGLILTGAAVGGGMAELFGDLPSALVPLNGRPLLLSILQELARCGVHDVTLAVGHRAARVRELCARFVSAPTTLHFVDVDPRASAGAALAGALRRMPAGAPVLVHLGDTLVPGLADHLTGADDNRVLVSADVPDAGRWCSVHAAADGRVSAFVERDEAAGAGQVAVGVYRIAACPARLSDLPARPEISDVLRACAADWHAHPVAAWHDVGHLDRYQVARKRVLAARAFNTLQFDDFLGTITKRSRHWEKLQQEVRWALDLPPALQVLAPRVLDFVPDGPRTQVTMEYYGYPSAAELWLYGSWPASVMGGVVRRLCGVLDRFAAHPLPLRPDDILHMVRDKTEQRLAQARRDSPVLRALLDAPTLCIDGTEQPGFPVLWAQARPHCEALVRRLDGRPVQGTLVHGDYCLSNILYDIGGGIVRLIDARGRWARSGGQGGDPRYDVAKLRHSVAGGYDFIVGDLFELDFDGERRLDLRDQRDARHHEVAAVLDHWIAQRHDLPQVMLIESLLFLSMLPLHEDRPRRQLAMFARGMRGLHEALARLVADGKTAARDVAAA